MWAILCEPLPSRSMFAAWPAAVLRNWIGAPALPAIASKPLTVWVLLTAKR